MRLFDMLPGYYAPGYEMQEWQDALDVQIRALWEARREAVAQLFVQTADGALDRWEDAFGIPTEVEKDIDYRRRRVMAKMRGVGTTTVEHIRNTAQTFADGEVKVWEYPAEYRFAIDFLIAPEDFGKMDDFAAAIEEMKPAHLGYVLRVITSTEMPLNTLVLRSGLGYAVTVSRLPKLERNISYATTLDLRSGLNYPMTESRLPRLERNISYAASMNSGSAVHSIMETPIGRMTN